MVWKEKHVVKKFDEFEAEWLSLHAQVNEILDSELLGEGLIPTLWHAHGELFFENPETMPYVATTYGQVSILWCLDTACDELR